jgi:hypothetical protein
MNFFEAESIALNYAYTQFFGENQPVGIAYTFVRDKINNNAWSDNEKSFAKKISYSAIKDFKNKKLIELINEGIVPDCAMVRRYMSTGSAFTEKGYAY